MAERLIFHYHDRDTLLHRVDARIKLFSLLFITIVVFNTPDMMIFPMLLLLFAAGIAGRLPLTRYGREFTFFFVFASLIFFTRWLSGNLLTDALFSALRFLTVVAGGILLTDSTSPEEISLSVFWLISPFSRKRAYEFSAAFSLTISFIPMLFDTSSQMSEARKARRDRRFRRPLRRIISMGSGLMDQIIERAEEVSFALESRRFTPYVLHDSLNWRGADSLILVGIIIYLVVTSILVALM